MGKCIYKAPLYKQIWALVLAEAFENLSVLLIGFLNMDLNMAYAKLSKC